jgi:hypothetical protein
MLLYHYVCGNKDRMILYIFYHICFALFLSFYKNKIIYADVELSRKGMLKINVDLRKTDEYICESFYNSILDKINELSTRFIKLEYFKENIISIKSFTEKNLEINTIDNSCKISNLIMTLNMNCPYTDIFSYSWSKSWSAI